MKEKSLVIGSLEHAQKVVRDVGERYFYEHPEAINNAVVSLNSIKTQYDYPYTVVLLNPGNFNVITGASKYNPADVKLGQPFNKKSGYCIALSRAARQYIRTFV